MRPRHLRKGPNLGNLIEAFVLFSVVIMSVGFGIFAGYGAFLAVLHAFGDQPSKTTPVLVPSQSHAGGD